MLGRGTSRPTASIYRKQDPEAEIWTINQDRVPEASRHFQIHDDELVSPEMRKLLNCEDIDASKVQLYTWENYPIDSIRRKLLNSTPDYMLAIADLEGFQRIYLPGLDFGGTRDPLELYSARYWVGVLEGKGAKVFLSPVSRMFHCSVYNHEEEFIR
jgi:hypothetical protein